jgi:hypothetical protein
MSEFGGAAPATILLVQKCCKRVDACAAERCLHAAGSRAGEAQFGELVAPTVSVM